MDRIEIISNKIAELELSLSSNVSPVGDYKIIKIYEARLKGEDDPYNFEELVAKRDAVRAEINALQKELAELTGTTK